MPVSRKKKRPKKRATPAVSSAPSEFKAIIETPELPTPGEMAAFHALGVRYYNRGREDKASGAAALTLRGFIKAHTILQELERENPVDFPVIAQAHYAQYIAGYTGAAYRGIVFKEIRI